MFDLIKFLGISSKAASHKEILIAGIGSLLGIAAIYIISSSLLSSSEAVYIIPSMGASAVLLFAAPHAPFSQPWNLLTGHTVSAFVGVLATLLISDIAVAAPLGVGLAVMAMHYTRSIHPPGGATALAAIIGSANLKSLGFMYILTPVLLNTVTILIIALLFNGLFRNRRYPLYLHNLIGDDEA